ncbi:sporulation protein YtfJ [Fervidicella metallireducens AeB]|uniref:Sporulation protein YtfJ n=1 Tax=Fervidicella metallireducens AeB TaxID=1403537 RepID=A0A017RSL6_9CLOT|nr:GerW family sporulation protein [Fervidicella metallireducens]EYE87763.1 sporulation protein YtfJ [Fervidicella metallireducens AeB]
MSNHPIEGLMKTTMDSLKEMIDVNTIVGDPVKLGDDGVIIPISKVSIGFASGGTEFSNTNSQSEEDYSSKFPFGGGSGAGVSVQPVAFLVVNKDQVKLLPVDEVNSIERIIDSIPDFVETIAKMFKKNNENKEDKIENTIKADEF